MSYTKDQRNSRGRFAYTVVDQDVVDAFNRNWSAAGDNSNWRPMPPPRRDYHTISAWKARPVQPGDQPFHVHDDGVVDLHPSQWKEITHGL